jgi:hypothetical protein
MIRDDSGPVTDLSTSLVRVVTQAAGSDGYGVCWERDDEGQMRLYTSRRHLGNNPYIPRPEDASFEASALVDDDAAKEMVAKEIAKRGIFHSRWSKGMTLDTLTFDDDNKLTHISDVSVEQLAEDLDCPIGEVGKSYGIDPSDVQAQTPTMSA